MFGDRGNKEGVGLFGTNENTFVFSLPSFRQQAAHKVLQYSCRMTPRYYTKVLSKSN